MTDVHPATPLGSPPASVADVAPGTAPGGAREVPGCPFCDRIARGEYDYENASNVAFQPLSPVTPGHFLVVPRRHIAHALEGPSRAASALAFAAHLAGDMGLESANFITSAGSAATQTVFHLHMHVVPRREGDGLTLPWTGQRKDGDHAANRAGLPKFLGHPDDLCEQWMAETWENDADAAWDREDMQSAYRAGRDEARSQLAAAWDALAAERDSLRQAYDGIRANRDHLREQCVRLGAESERLRAALELIDPARLDLLADWMDHDDAVHGRMSFPEVQADLWRWAKAVRAALEARDE